jgi:hypothetical protein
MGMNNIYYRFQHLSGNERFTQIPARLRMQVIRSHGTNPVDSNSGAWLFQPSMAAASASKRTKVC